MDDLAMRFVVNCPAEEQARRPADLQVLRFTNHRALSPPLLPAAALSMCSPSTAAVSDLSMLPPSSARSPASCASPTRTPYPLPRDVPSILTRLQESFERLLFQVEAAFWFYDDEYREIWPHAFPCFTLLQFAQKLFSMCDLLKPFAPRTEELYEKFRQYKIQIPTCGAMLLNPGATKVLLVMGHKSKSWGFPKGKIDRDEEFPACAMREVLEEVGYDISNHIDQSVFIEKQHKGLPLTRLYIARNVPEDTVFITRTKKEIDEIKWHKIADLPTSKEAACRDEKKKSFWMVAPYILWLKQQLAAEKKKKKSNKGKSDKSADKDAAGQGSGAGASNQTLPAQSSTDVDATSALLAALSGVTAGEAILGATCKNVSSESASSSGKAKAPKARKTTAQSTSSHETRINTHVPGGSGGGVKQQGSRANAGRRHPFLDFAFDAQAILKAVG